MLYSIGDSCYVYVILYMYVLMYRDSDDIIVYKSGGVIGGFFVFSPPFVRVEISDPFGRKIGGLNGDFSIPRFRIV